MSVARNRTDTCSVAHYLWVARFENAAHFLKQKREQKKKKKRKQQQQQKSLTFVIRLFSRFRNVKAGGKFSEVPFPLYTEHLSPEIVAVKEVGPRAFCVLAYVCSAKARGILDGLT